MSETRTIGQKVHQWLTNLTILIPILSALGLSSIYGNSDTVKKWVHGKPSPLTVEEVTPEVEQINYDRIIKELIALNKKQDDRMSDMQLQINKLKEWHE